MSVADILEQLAANAGRGQLARGALIANTIAGAAAVPGQILDDRRRQQLVDEENARRTEQLGFQRDANTRAGKDQALQDAAAQRKDQEEQDRKAIISAGLDTTGPTPGWKFEPAVLEAMKRGRKDVAKELIDQHDKVTRDAAPKNPTALAFDAANPNSPTQAQSTTALDLARPPTAAPAPIKPPAVGTFEDYLTREADAAGKPTSQLTPADVLKARNAFEGAGRAPKEAPAEKAGLWVQRDGQTIRVQERDIRLGDKPASTREQGRPVTSGDAGRVAELDSSIDDLKVLGAAVSAAGDTGTVAKLGASAPNWVTDLTGWGTSAKKKQALIDRVKQVIGKALEGGVLRKEDEIKYEKILPTIADVNAVVVSKLAGIDAAIRQKRVRHLEALTDAGYDTSRFQRTETAPIKVGGFTVVVK